MSPLSHPPCSRTLQSDNVYTPLGAVDMTVNAILMFDILLSFRLTYLGEKVLRDILPLGEVSPHLTCLGADGDGKLVKDHLRIAVNYLTGWFILDLASSLPFDNMTGDTNLSVLKALRVGYSSRPSILPWWFINVLL